MTFYVALSDPSAGSALSNRALAHVKIIDNDVVNAMLREVGFRLQKKKEVLIPVHLQGVTFIWPQSGWSCYFVGSSRQNCYLAAAICGCLLRGRVVR